MQYRDLIPDRQSGQLIASHIRIPRGGPVGDNVHHQDIRRQLIYGCRGWVRRVYENQDDPFVMHSGHCVLQPRHIRHRLLESSEGLGVIELGNPAEQMTGLDQDMSLPTGRELPACDFSGQHFLLHQVASAPGTSIPPMTGLCVISASARQPPGSPVPGIFAAPKESGACVASAIQDEALAFAFVLDGYKTLQLGLLPAMTPKAGDAFVIRAGTTRTLADCSPDWQWLQVCLSA